MDENKLNPENGNSDNTNADNRVAANKLDDSADYIAAIKKLKDNTVSKDDYNKLAAKNKELLDTLVNGGQIAAPKAAADEPSAEQLKANLCKPGITNLDYIKTALQLRQTIIKQGGLDPFLPNGKMVDVTYDDLKSVEEVVDVLEDCVKAADDDSSIFTNELQRRLNDTAMLPKRK